MTPITIFDPLTGKVIRVVTCDAQFHAMQVGPGEAHVDGEFGVYEFYFDAGTPVPLPPKPSPHHTFNYTTKQWEPDAALAATQVQTQRLKLLQESDWAALPDVPMTPEERVLWAAYRQGLRDVPAQAGYPLNVVWPVKP